MKKQINATLVGLLSLTSLGSIHSSAQAVEKGTVNTASLTVRSGPSPGYKAVDYVQQGESVTIEKTVNGWAYVQTKDGKGYVSKKYLTVSASASDAAPAPSSAAIRYVNVPPKEMLNVRSGPSTKNQVTGKLANGAAVHVLGREGQWVRMSSGSLRGYVHEHYLQSAPSSQPSTHSSVQTYKVQRGDTLYSIARQFGTTVQTLQTLNGMSSGFIRTGQSLRVTGTSSSPKPAIPQSENRNQALAGRTIVLDPGHGGPRPGAVANGVVEEEVALDVSLRVKQLLVNQGARVIMTRESDRACVSGTSNSVDLACRPAIANQNGADLFLSIHANAAGAGADGAEIFYYQNRDRQMAQTILQHYLAQTGLDYRRVAYGDFAVIRGSRVPGALIELGFLTNPKEAALLKSSAFRDKAASGIVSGIVAHFN